MYTQTFIQAQTKENIKASRHWPLCGEFTGGPTQRASNAEKISIGWRHHVQMKGELVIFFESIISVIVLQNKQNRKCGTKAHILPRVYTVVTTYLQFSWQYLQ